MAGNSKKNTEINGYTYYRTVINIGKDSNGQPIKKQFYGSSKLDAELKKKQYIKSLELGLNPDLSNQSLNQAMYEWLWNVEKFSGIKSSSFERYEGIYRNYLVNTDLGILIISEIKKLALIKYYNKLRSQGKSYSQIYNLQKLLSKFFGYAETEGYIIKNPCKGIKISKDNEEDIDECDKVVETFTKEEVNRIVSSLENTKIKYIIMFALLTGAREGEILALEKTDVQENVRINKTLRTVKVFDDDGSYHYEKKITKPKSKTSNREVPIPDILKPELKRLEKLVTEEKLKLGPAYEDNNLQFPSLTGTYMDAKNLRISWQRVLKKAGVTYKKFHALRHTYATRLFEKGVSIVTVSNLLGHSSIKTTEIYTHVLNDIKDKEIQCLNDMFL